MKTKNRKRVIKYVSISDLRPDPLNPRLHSEAQIEDIARSIKTFGFNAPILVDRFGKLLAGHGRLEAALRLGMTNVPVVFLDDLTETQARAYMLADNKVTDGSRWDDKLVAVHLKDLSNLALDFDIQATGFEIPDIDLRVLSLDEPVESDAIDSFSMSDRPAVSLPNDLWCLSEHRLICGSALDRATFATLMEGDRASVVIADFPYNVKISGNVSGLGKIKHREFAMASGEMSEIEFTRFLTCALSLIKNHLAPGALAYGFMDWRHMGEILAAGDANDFELLNLCVWVKTNGGMGSFYRSKHELVFVFRHGDARHRNNIQLGRFGRNRTNVWNYAGANVRPRKGKEDPLALHPTVKPIMLVADAIRDSTVRGDIVLDPFIGSGTTCLAAERTGRRCCGIELDPVYVDTAIIRWQTFTGRHAIHAVSGKTFEEMAVERDNANG